MSSMVDSRVVEMKFDNKEFEANARETINTLNNLKKALEENVNGSAFEELDRAAKNVDLSNIERSLDSLTDRFSTLGIVGMRVIQNLTDALTNFVSNGINKVFDTIQGGGSKRARDIETARFQLQGLIDDEAEVQAIMDNAKDSVSDTAYAYNEAAKAASMFAATGLRSGDEMERSLKAIAGVAATTSSDYESMAQIFTTVAGQGKVMTNQLNQLATRGLNAAATLKTFFNDVSTGAVDASDHVKELVSQLSGMGGSGVVDIGGDAWDTYDEAIKSSKKVASKQYKERQKALNDELKAVKEIHQKEYNDLQKTLNEEYNTKKKAFDAEYKALSESLSKELQEVQKANSQRLKEANEAYSDQVNAYREATEARIQLINDEYLESIKLIDEERYNKLKAIDDELKAMQELEEAESRQRINEANAEKKAAIEDLANRAKSKRARLEAAEAVADVNKAIADQQEAWRKQDRKNELAEERDQINEDANLRKQEALSRRDAAVKSVQDESSAKLKEMQKAHEVEIEQMRESQQIQIEELQKSKQAQLETLRESQQNELSQYRETQQLQLQSFRETQQEELDVIRERNQEELEALRELNNDKLSEMKQASKTGIKALSDFDSALGFTEADIRDLVTDGVIDFETFSEAMATTFGDHAKDANKTFDGAMANIRAALARTGEMFYAPFYQQEGPMVRLFNTIRIKINEMNAALKPFANILTLNILKFIPEIERWVSQISIDFKQLKVNANGTVVVIDKMAYAGMILTNIFWGIIDIFKAIGSYISPVVQAFREIFELDFSKANDASLSFRNFTESLKASEKTAKLIHDIFFIFFNLLKEGIGIVSNFIAKLKPFSTLLNVVGNAASFITTSVLETVEAFTNWVTTSETVANAIKIVSNWVDKFIENLKLLKRIIEGNFKLYFGGFNLGYYFADGFLKGFVKMGKDIVSGIIGFFKSLIADIQNVLGIHSPSTVMYQFGVWMIEGLKLGIEFMMNDVIPFVVDVFLELINSIKNVILSVDWASVITSVGDFISNWITNTANVIAEGIPRAIEKIGEFLEGIAEYGRDYEFDDGEGSAGWNFILALIRAMGKAVEALGAGLYAIAKSIWDSLVKFFREFSIRDAINIAKTFVEEFSIALVTKLSQWKDAVSKALKNFFGDIDGPSVIALATGISIIYLFIKACYALFKLTNPLDTFTLTLNAFKNTLLAFSYDLKANALLKVSASIALLVGVIIALYEVFKHMSNPKDVGMFVAATIVVGAATFAVAYIATQIIGLYNNLNTINGALGNIGLTLKKMATALEVRVIVGTIITAIGKIIFDVAALASIYKADKEAFWEAISVMGWIAGGLAVLMAIAGIITWLLTEKSDIQGFKNITMSLLAFSGSALLIVLAIKEITKLDFSEEDIPKLGILAGIIVAILIVIGVLSKSNLKENSGTLTLKVGTIIAFAVLMLVVVSTFKKLVKEGYSVFNNLSQIAMLAVLLAIVTTVCYFLGKAGRASVGVTKYGSAVIGIAVVLLASLYALKKLQDFDPEAYWRSLVRLAGIFIAMGFVCYAASFVYSNDGYKNVIAVGMLIAELMVVMTVLTKLDQNKLLQSAISLGVVLVALGAALYGAGSLSKSNLATFGSLLVMLVAVLGIGAILVMIAQYPWEQIAAAGVSFAIVILAFSKAFRRIQEITTTVKWKTIGQFLAFTLSLIPIAVALAFVSTAGKWNSILAAGTAIAEVIIAYGVVFKNMQGVSISWSTIGQFILGSLGLIPIVAVMGILAMTTNWNSMLAAGTAIGEVILAYGYVFTKLNKAKEVKINTIGNFLLGTISLIIIAGVLRIVIGKDNKWSNMLAAATGIGEVILAYGYVFRKLDGINVDKNQVAEFLKGSLSIILIGAVIGVMAYFCDWDSLLLSATAISEVLIAYGHVFRKLEGVTVSDDDIKNFLKGCLAVGIIGAILAAILIITDASGHPIKWDQILSTATAISEVLDACAAAALIISRIDGTFNRDSVKYLIEGIVVAIAAAAILQHFTDENGDPANTLATAIGISAIIIAVGVMAALVGEVAKVTRGVGAVEMLKTGGVLELLISGLVLLAEGVAGIAAAFGNNAELAKNNLILIGEGFGGFFGALIDGFLTLSGKGIAEFGTDLTDFMTNASGFFAGLGMFDEDMQKRAKTLAAVAETLAKAEFLDAITGIIEKLVPFEDDVSGRFENVGKAVRVFAETVGDTGGWNTKNFAEAAYQLSLALSNLNPVHDLIVGWELGTLGEKFNGLAKAVAGIIGKDGFNGVPNSKDYQKAAKSMGYILDWLVEYKPKTFEQIWLRAQRIANDDQVKSGNLSIGTALEIFAKKVRIVGAYGAQITDLAPFKNIVNAANLLFPLCTGSEKMISENNIIGQIIGGGTNDPKSFISSLLVFVTRLVGTSPNDVSNIWYYIKDISLDMDKFDQIKEAAEKMGEIGNYVPTINGNWKKFWIGDNSAAGFASDYLQFVKNLKEVKKEVDGSEIDSTTFIPFVFAAKNLLEVVETLRSYMLFDNDTKYIDMPSHLLRIGEAFVTFGESMVTFSTSVLKSYEGFDSANRLLDTFVDLLPDLLKFDGGKNITDFFANLKQTAASGLEAFLKHFRESEAPVQQAIGTMFGFISTAMTSKKDMMEGFGRIMITNYFAGDRGMRSQEAKNAVVSAMEDVMYTAENAANRISFYEAGKNAMLGFARGLTNSDAMRDIRTNAHNMAVEAYNESMRALDENSPSRKMMQVGAYAGEGFALGLEEWISAAGDVGYNVGDTALDGLREALKDVSENIQNGDDFNPVITPVLDLSNIENGVGQIGGMLDINDPIRFNTSNIVNPMTTQTDQLREGYMMGAQFMFDKMSEELEYYKEQNSQLMSTMSDYLSHLQVVMDTGELVGVLTNPIDNELGFNKVLNARGVR